MARKRRVYTPEFKAEAVNLGPEQTYPGAQAARSLGLGGPLLRSRNQGLESRGDQALPGHGQLPPSRGRCAASRPRTSGCGRSGAS